MLRNGFCGTNNGEFIIWSIEVLNSYKSNCEKCNSTTTQNNNHQHHQQQHSSEPSGEDTNQSHTNGTSTSSQKSCICSEFDDLLEQSFYCLFGFKKKTARYLKNHSVVKQDYTLEGALLIYSYFTPTRLPEYDDEKKFSITSEVGFFLLNLKVSFV